MTRSEHPEHISIEQLSAFLDQQLTSQEQAAVDAHLHMCEQCRLSLTDLRAMVALVRALPQPALPRSFALPLNVTPFPIQATHEERQAEGIPARRQPLARNGLRRSLRFVSAIAATLGLLIMLSGLWNATLHGTGGAASESAAPAFTSAGQAPSVSPRTLSPGAAEGTHVVTQPGLTGTGQQRQTTTPTPQPQRTGTATNGVLQNTGGGHLQQQTPGSFVLPSFLDLGTTEGRLSLGLALALLGIIGLLMTRRRYRGAINQ